MRAVCVARGFPAMLSLHVCLLPALGMLGAWGTHSEAVPPEPSKCDPQRWLDPYEGVRLMPYR